MARVDGLDSADSDWVDLITPNPRSLYVFFPKYHPQKPDLRRSWSKGSLITNRIMKRKNELIRIPESSVSFICAVGRRRSNSFGIELGWLYQRESPEWVLRYWCFTHACSTMFSCRRALTPRMLRGFRSIFYCCILDCACRYWVGHVWLNSCQNNRLGETGFTTSTTHLACERQSYIFRDVSSTWSYSSGSFLSL